MAVLLAYDYVFAIVLSRSISYGWAMVCALVFELLDALTVGSRTAVTIKNGIILHSAFQDDAGKQMLAFTCAPAGASSWEWGWNQGQGVADIFSGLAIASAAAEVFAAAIFTLLKFTVHMHGSEAKVPNHAVVQHDDDSRSSSKDGNSMHAIQEEQQDKNLTQMLTQMEFRPVKTYKELLTER
ncbi:MAG: hypothetical protein Q9159_003192 [Coniocarpon cinnabarinum]